MKTRQRSQGTTLYVMGFPVAVLQSDQQLFSIQQRREGRALKQIHVHPFLDFNKLEQFFELQENDILRITVLQPKTATDTAHIHMYDINVSTGEISRPLEDLAE